MLRLTSARAASAWASLQAADWRFSVTGNFMRFADSSFFGLYATRAAGGATCSSVATCSCWRNHSESVGALYRRQINDGSLSVWGGTDRQQLA